MSFETTAIIVIAAMLVFLLSLFLQRKAEPMTRWSYVPWVAIQFTALVVIFVFGAHLYSEWRGEPLVGTRNPLRGL